MCSFWLCLYHNVLYRRAKDQHVFCYHFYLLHYMPSYIFFCDCAINIWPQHLLAIDSFNGCPRLSPPHIQDKGTLVVFLCVVSFQRTKYISPASQAWCLGIFFCTIEHKSNLNKHLYYRKEFIKKSSRNSYFADFQ
jgi:hypothetical protein